MEENKGEDGRTQDQLATMSQSGDRSSLQSEEVPLPEVPEVPEDHVLLGGTAARIPVNGVPENCPDHPYQLKQKFSIIIFILDSRI